MTPSHNAPAQGWLIANVLAQISFGLLAMTICLPSMQEWGTLFGTDQASVQLTFSAYVITYGSLQLVYGPLSDRYGRKGVLMVGLSLACAGSWLAALAPTLQTLTLARGLQGAGSAAGMVIGRSMVQDLFHGPARTRVMAYIGMALGLCPPLATLLGGQIHVRLGWQANFTLIGAMAAILLVAVWRLPLPKKAVVTYTHWLKDMLQAYTRLGKERAFLLYVIILAMTTSTFYVFLAGAPIVLRGYGVGPQSMGWYIMSVPLAYIVGNYLTSHLIHRWGERKMMLLGQAATVSGLCLMLVLGLAGWQTPLAFALPLLLLGMGHGFLNPPALAGTVGLIPALAGSAAAVAGLAQQLMGALAGYLVGFVSHEGSVNMGLLMLGFTLCGLAAQFALQYKPLINRT
jgi:DHA1 family bicyclomycin/chloramphenicol resistance-like MFS transporter